MRLPPMSVTLVVVVLVGGLAVSDADAQFKPGFSLDAAKEKRLEGTTARALAVLKAEKPDYKALVPLVVEARETANALVGLAEKTDPPPVDEPALPEKSPVVLLEGSTAEQVFAAWHEQLVLRVRAVHTVLSGEDLEAVPLWGEVVGVGWRDRNDLSKRARPAAMGLREAHVFALLLARDKQVVPVGRGEALFADDFAKGTDNWFLYGPADTTNTEHGLRRRNRRARNADSMIWTKKTFNGNFLFEFTFIANNGGSGPGALFAVCGRPVKEGGDLSVSCGETMDTYNFGVHAYHFSLHRGETNICNGRKVGTGLYLTASRTPDPAKEVARPYRVAIGKWDNIVFLLVDGKFLHSYVDAGTFGPPLTSGHCGMRHWGGLDATYADVQVSRLVGREDG